MRALALIAGVLLTLGTLFGLVQSMLVPRDSRNIISRSVARVVTGLAHAPLALMRSYARQDRWLAASAPIAVFLQLVVYVAILIVGIALIMYGLGIASVGESLYQAGSTFTTLGLVIPASTATIVMGFVSAFIGLVVIAVFIGYLLAIYGAFIARESAMARVSVVAGEPAWGPQILVRARLLGIPDDRAPMAMAWVDWITSVRLSQRVNPVLSFMRSTSTQRHWTTTSLAVLDAAALRMALDPDLRGSGYVELIATGATSFHVLARASAGDDPELNSWDLDARLMKALEGGAPVEPDCGVTRAQFDDALAELAAVGIPLPEDRDAAWVRFAGLRQLYAPSLAELARRYHAVPAPWSGPRRPALDVMWPVRAGLAGGA